MAVTNYYSVGGQLIGEETAGVRTDYLTDALGSVTETVDQTGNVMNTYRYKPYGGLLAKTGGAPDPKFAWVGSYGYRQTGKKYSDVYVRARHYGTNQSQWTSIDGFWPEEHPYAYSLCNPVSYRDSTGQSTCAQCCCCPENATIGNITKIDGNNRFGNSYDVTLKYNYHVIGSNESPGDCGFAWEEKTDNPAVPGIVSGAWGNLYKDYPISSTFAPWNNRAKPCPGTASAVINDRPALVLTSPYPPNQNRTLCVRVVMTKAPGCTCSLSQVVVTAMQYLYVDNRVGKARQFVSPYSVKYCKWP